MRKKFLEEGSKKSKLRTYRKYKTSLKLEKYLLTPGYFKIFNDDLRTGTHKLPEKWEKKCDTHIHTYTHYDR